MGFEWVRENISLIAPLIVLELVLIVLGLRDLIRRRPEEVLGGNKWLWGIIIVVIATFGPIAYFAFGRRRE